MSKMIVWLALLLCSSLALAETPLKDVDQPSRAPDGDVDLSQLPQVKIEQPKLNYKPTVYKKKTPLIIRLDGLKKRLQSSKEPEKLVFEFLKLEKAIRAADQSTIPQLLYWDLYFGLALSYIQISPVYIPVAEFYFHKTIKHSKTLDALKGAGGFYNVACALTLQDRVPDALLYLTKAFEKEATIKQGHFFMMSQQDPTLASLRKDPGYDKLMRKYGKQVEKQPESNDKP